MPEHEAVAEADKPFYMAMSLVGAWVASVMLSLFYLGDVEMAKFVTIIFGGPANLGVGYYLRHKNNI